MQFIIFDNGKAGFNGEHSNMEATITLVVATGSWKSMFSIQDKLKKQFL